MMTDKAVTSIRISGVHFYQNLKFINICDRRVCSKLFCRCCYHLQALICISTGTFTNTTSQAPDETVTNTKTRKRGLLSIKQPAKVLCDSVFHYFSLTGVRCDETWLMMTLTNSVFLKSVCAKTHREAASASTVNPRDTQSDMLGGSTVGLINCYFYTYLYSCALAYK